VGLSAEAGLATAWRENERLEELCAEPGRTVVRSALRAHALIAETPWRSEDAFHEFVGRWEEAGFDELIVFYPWDLGMPAGSVEPGLPERMLGKR
jgi:hypothetical protein